MISIIILALITPDASARDNFERCLFVRSRDEVENCLGVTDSDAWLWNQANRRLCDDSYKSIGYIITDYDDPCSDSSHADEYLGIPI